MTRDALLGFAVAPLLLLSSGADHSDISGTYVGDGQITYRPNGGLSKDLTFSGTADNGDAIRYLVDAKPAK
jgi:hypothetical protein